MSGMDLNQRQQSCESLSTSIKAELSRLPPFSRISFISIVPKILRQVNEAAFTPLIISIGPLHQKDQSFLPMEAVKLNYLKSFLTASSANADLITFLRTLADKESSIRACYTDPIHLSTDEFTRMVLVDSAFIIQLFRRASSPNFLRVAGDPIFQGPHRLAEVKRDIQLAENQLPFFILVDLYWMAFKPDLNNIPGFRIIASKFFNLDCHPIESKDFDVGGVRHLLDLSRRQYPHQDEMVMVRPLSSPTQHTITCPTATSLYEAGIKFRPGNLRGYYRVVFDAKTGFLTIPKLRLTDVSGVSLRNTIAFEQCHLRTDTYATDFAYFMDCLINTARDVELLVKAGVVENYMGDNEEAAELFNSLCKHVDVSSDTLVKCYGLACDSLNSYYAKSWNRHKATLKQTYFSHPWAVISVVYAFVILLLTIAQVVTGVISLL